MKRLPILWPKEAPGSKTYWRSLDQLANTPDFQEFVQREFPQGASELSSPISRRSFMSLMGASLALAGMSGCRRPVEKILPYTKAPEESVIGLPTYYATTMTLGSQAYGLLVESNDGRPTKIEGNPHHPMSMGATTLQGQATILDLYDPDRSTAPLIGTEQGDLDGAIKKIKERRDGALARQGAGLRVLSGALVSPTLLRIRDRLLGAMPQAVWHTWEPICDDEVRAGSRLAFDDDVHARVKLEHADTILVLDADLFGSDPDALRHARTFANRRRVEKPTDTMNRLYVVESAWTTVGAAADHRLRVRPSEIAAFAAALAAELGKIGAAMPAGVVEALPKGGKAPDEKFVAAVAKDLLANKDRSVVVVGRGQPREVHALVHAVNAALGAPGNTIDYVRLQDAGRKLDKESLQDLLGAVDRGEVDTLVVLGGNPAFDAPADLKFDERVRAKKDKTTVIHLGMFRDETAALAQLHVPRSHFLEAWGDARATDGTISVVQPLIAPLYASLSDIEMVSVLIDGQKGSGHDLVRDSWRGAAQVEEAANEAANGPARAAAGKAEAPKADAAQGKPDAAKAVGPKTDAAQAGKMDGAKVDAPVADAAKVGETKVADAKASTQVVAAKPPATTTPAPDAAKVAGAGVAVAATGPSLFELAFDRHWRQVLRDGMMHEGAPPERAPVVQGDKVAAALSASTAFRQVAADSMEIVFPPDAKMFDGRFANNAWLQELSDPITKLSWDNAAILSVRTAKKLGVEKDDMVQVTVRGRTLEAPVYVQAGQADDAVTLTLGYGRRVTGRVGAGAGFNGYLLRDSAALGFDVGVTVKSAGRKYEDPRDESFVDITKITGLVTTQNHFSMEGRPLVREASLAEFKKEPDFAKHAVHHPELKSLWDDPAYAVRLPDEEKSEHKKKGDSEEKPEAAKKSQGQQWGMAIDLSACIGCNACSVACQAENNIPVVGKAQVRKGREMAWIRIDRYFSGDLDNPEAIQQPVACQQCENAPCENVCPVGATVHSDDGLNDMIYNRCIGTRYCANNCPYKVRRFNYLDWRGDVPEVAKLKYNPDVTLRSRGVMEKCTYCTQRIRGAQRDAKLQGHDTVLDGVITPACAQACPAEAIVFGDITDPQSRVSLVKKSQRNYEMLAELNVRPRTSYLARIRNQNPELSSHE